MAETHLVACLVDYFDNCPGYQRWDKNQPHFLFDQLNDNLFFFADKQTNLYVYQPCIKPSNTHTCRSYCVAVSNCLKKFLL